MILEKEFEYLGYKCQVKINDYCGFRCGYVELPKGFPEFDKYDIDCHGGVTYHEGNIIGFDCGHYGDGIDLELISDKITRDAQKKIQEILNFELTPAKSLEFVENELIGICEQLKKIKGE